MGFAPLRKLILCLFACVVAASSNNSERRKFCPYSISVYYDTGVVVTPKREANCTAEEEGLVGEMIDEYFDQALLSLKRVKYAKTTVCNQNKARHYTAFSKYHKKKRYSRIHRRNYYRAALRNRRGRGDRRRRGNKGKTKKRNKRNKPNYGINIYSKNIRNRIRTQRRKQRQQQRYAQRQQQRYVQHQKQRVQRLRRQTPKLPTKRNRGYVTRARQQTTRNPSTRGASLASARARKRGIDKRRQNRVPKQARVAKKMGSPRGKRPMESRRNMNRNRGIEKSRNRVPKQARVAKKKGSPRARGKRPMRSRRNMNRNRGGMDRPPPGRPKGNGRSRKRRNNRNRMPRRRKNRGRRGRKEEDDSNRGRRRRMRNRRERNRNQMRRRGNNRAPMGRSSRSRGRSSGRRRRGRFGRRLTENVNMISLQHREETSIFLEQPDGGRESFFLSMGHRRLRFDRFIYRGSGRCRLCTRDDFDKRRFLQIMGNETIGDETMGNKTIDNDTIMYETMSNETMSNETMSNETMSNEAMSNEATEEKNVPISPRFRTRAETRAEKVLKMALKENLPEGHCLRRNIKTVTVVVDFIDDRDSSNVDC